MLGGLLAAAPDKIKQKLFDAFDIQALYSKTHHQVTLWATITPSTPAALAAIIAASETPNLAGLLAAQDHASDLASQPGAAKPHDHEPGRRAECGIRAPEPGWAPRPRSLRH